MLYVKFVCLVLNKTPVDTCTCGRNICTHLYFLMYVRRVPVSDKVQCVCVLHVFVTGDKCIHYWRHLLLETNAFIARSKRVHCKMHIITYDKRVCHSKGMCANAFVGIHLYGQNAFAPKSKWPHLKHTFVVEGKHVYLE